MAARGNALLSPTVTRRLISEYVSRPLEAVPAAGLEALTNRECEVMALVARGLSADEIAAHMVIRTTTAKTHVSHPMTKLHARDRAQLVVYAYESASSHRNGTGEHSSGNVLPVVQELMIAAAAEVVYELLTIRAEFVNRWRRSSPCPPATTVARRRCTSSQQFALRSRSDRRRS